MFHIHSRLMTWMAQQISNPFPFQAAEKSLNRRICPNIFLSGWTYSYRAAPIMPAISWPHIGGLCRSDESVRVAVSAS